MEICSCSEEQKQKCTKEIYQFVDTISFGKRKLADYQNVAIRPKADNMLKRYRMLGAQIDKLRKEQELIFNEYV